MKILLLFVFLGITQIGSAQEMFNPTNLISQHKIQKVMIYLTVMDSKINSNERLRLVYTFDTLGRVISKESYSIIGKRGYQLIEFYYLDSSLRGIKYIEKDSEGTIVSESRPFEDNYEFNKESYDVKKSNYRGTLNEKGLIDEYCIYGDDDKEMTGKVKAYLRYEYQIR